MLAAKEEFERGTKAVIYCRVSSSKQTTHGDGLGSQETRCREYAKYKGCEVSKVFTDDMTGSLTTRPGMQSMLSFLRKSSRKEEIVVIIDDISRLARGIEAHLQLRSDIASAGGILKSPTIEFGEDSDSILVENLLASVSQHQRQKNGEQTINRMRARTQNGYWCFQAPIGYKYQRTAGHGNLLHRNEPYASILQEAFEGYASGRFETQVEVKRFLEAHPEYPNDLPNGEIRNQRITDLLTRPIYAGYLEVPNWNISLRKGHHEGLISLETFQKIQKRLKGTAKAPARKEIGQDFPLRGFVLCSDCNKPLTACWSKGKTKKYPYYLCPTKGCSSYRKSIPRQKLEDEFEGIIRTLQLSEGQFATAKAAIINMWDQRTAQTAGRMQGLKIEAGKIDEQIEHLMDRIVEVRSSSVIAAYEKRIARLEKQKLILDEKIENSGKPRHACEDLFELAFKFLASPCKLWDSGQYHLKKTVLRLAFAERISYCRDKGLRTPELALPFKLLKSICGDERSMARRGGFEPPTPRFVV